MNFKTHNDKVIEVGGFARQGTLNASYAKIVETFGEPEKIDWGKSDVQWTIEFENGTVSIIYNYNNGKNAHGEKGIATEDITSWSIGGYMTFAAILVINEVNNSKS